MTNKRNTQDDDPANLDLQRIKQIHTHTNELATQHLLAQRTNHQDQNQIKQRFETAVITLYTELAPYIQKYGTDIHDNTELPLDYQQQNTMQGLDSLLELAAQKETIEMQENSYRSSNIVEKEIPKPIPEPALHKAHKAMREFILKMDWGAPTKRIIPERSYEDEDLEQHLDEHGRVDATQLAGD